VHRRLFAVTFHATNQGGNGLLIKAEEQGFRGRRAQDFVEEDFEIRIGDILETQRRFAHFADAFAKFGDMFGAVVAMQTESGLQFIDGFGGDARNENVAEALEGVVIALEAGDAFFHGKAGLHGLFHGAKPRQHRKIFVARVVHKSSGNNLPSVPKRRERKELTGRRCCNHNVMR
jgi:hypothetical protein